MRKFVNLLLDSKLKKDLLVLFILSILLAALEAIGVGAILPFVTMLQSPQIIESSERVQLLKNLMQIKNADFFIIIFGLLLLATFILKNLLALIQIRGLHQYTQEFYRKLSIRLLTSYIARPYLFFLQNNSSILTKNVIMETKLIAEHIVEPSILIVAESLILLLMFVVLFLYHPLASLIILLLMFMLLYGVYRFSTKYTKRYGNQREQTFSIMNKTCHETLSGIKDIKISGSEQFFINLFDSVIGKNTRANTLNNFFQQVPRIFIETILVTLLLGTILYSKAYLDGPEVIIASLTMYLVAAYRIMPSVNRIITSIMRLRYIEAGFKAIAPSLYSVLEIDKMKREPLRSLELNIGFTLKNIGFKYPDNEQEVLTGINLHVNKGEVVGFVGESGVGKSTLFNVILGLLDAREGQIYIDGTPLDNKDIKAWQNLISYVPQQVFIVDDTLAHNIALGIPHDSINWDKVKDVTEIAQLSEFVNELPGRFNTILGDRGARLSGGQIQRIGIARALYRDKPVLVLDEATSALDEKTEEKLIAALNKQTEDKTILIIAHRTTSLRFCNKIYRFLGNGNVQEINYQQLINKESFKEKVNV